MVGRNRICRQEKTCCEVLRWLRLIVLLAYKAFSVINGLFIDPAVCWALYLTIGRRLANYMPCHFFLCGPWAETFLCFKVVENKSEEEYLWHGKLCEIRVCVCRQSEPHSGTQRMAETAAGRRRRPYQLCGLSAWLCAQLAEKQAGGVSRSPGSRAHLPDPTPSGSHHCAMWPP